MVEEKSLDKNLASFKYLVSSTDHFAKTELNKLHKDGSARVKECLSEINKTKKFLIHPIISACMEKYSDRFDAFAEAEDPFSFTTEYG